MARRLGSVAFRLALGYGVLVVATMAVISAALYFGTVVVIDRGIDAKLSKISEQPLGLEPENAIRPADRSDDHP